MQVSRNINRLATILVKVAKTFCEPISNLGALPAGLFVAPARLCEIDCQLCWGGLGGVVGVESLEWSGRGGWDSWGGMVGRLGGTSFSA